MPNVKRETLQNEILDTIEPGSTVYTDQAIVYDELEGEYIHETVNHIEEYVRGKSTQGPRELLVTDQARSERNLRCS